MKRAANEGPYRTSAEREREGTVATRARPEAGIGFLVIALWFASLVRFVAALLRQETFGPAACLAGLTVFVVPWLWWRGRR